MALGVRGQGGVEYLLITAIVAGCAIAIGVIAYYLPISGGGRNLEGVGSAVSRGFERFASSARGL
ncbi:MULTISPECIES: hypothetical protein [unclassified Methanopyrus]|uniref:hypothetical protein n=1 Tax=Methanopyrus sp. SNP6 TaxID=1937005 RepID=UPI0011E5D7F1|nr:hypothetical protein [Methanopyrus sp. SNP6]